LKEFLLREGTAEIQYFLLDSPKIMIALKTVRAAIAADWRRHVRVHRHHNQVSAYTTIMSLSIAHSKPCGDN
jgi:hypothetical protein